MEKKTLFSLRSGKNFWYYHYLLKLQLEGKGEETVMFCHPNAPTHKEADIIWLEIDGVPDFEVVYKDVADYPVVTVNKAIDNFEAGRPFWQGGKNP